MALLMPLATWAQDASTDTLSVEDEDFVRVSLCIASPGRIMYSALGHAFLRMECPTHQLDYVFSYESEDVSQRLLAYLSGNLKMGMRRVNTDEYMQFYRTSGRSVMAYPLNLPLDMKRELWRVLDERFHTDQSVPCDFIQRGCAKICLISIQQALNGAELHFASWPEHLLNTTRRGIVYNGLKDSPWCRFFFMTFSGYDNIDNPSPQDKILLPTDLLSLLQKADIDGRPVIKDAPTELVAASPKEQASSFSDWFTPIVLACILLGLALVNLRLRWQSLNLSLLGLQTLVGLLLLYMVTCSKLPAMQWTWLLIPFNPLPAILWKWRKPTYPILAVITTIWCLAMALWPNPMADWAHILMALAVAATLWGIAKNTSILNKQ